MRYKYPNSLDESQSIYFCPLKAFMAIKGLSFFLKIRIYPVFSSLKRINALLSVNIMIITH